MHIIKGLWNNIEDIQTAFNWPANIDTQHLEKFFHRRTLFAVCECKEVQYRHLVIYTPKKEDTTNTIKLYTSHGVSGTGKFNWKQHDVEINELIKSPNKLGPLFLKYQNEIARLFNLDIGQYIDITIS